MSFFDYFGFDVAAPSKPGFTARSFEEYAAPLKIYAAAYKEAEEDYSDLIAQTEAWKAKANQEKNPKAYALYKEYSDRLQKWSDEFSTGMNLTNRAQLMGLKRDYHRNIQPISDAYDIYKEKAKKRAEDPDAIWHNHDLRIDDYLDGDLGMEDDEHLDKKEVEAYAGEYIEKMLVDNADKLQVFKDAYNNLWQKKGGSNVTRDDYLELFNDAFGQGAFADALREMTRILKSDEYDDKGRDQIKQSIMKGFLKGLGAPSYEYLGFDKNTEFQNELIKAKKQHEYNMEEIGAKTDAKNSSNSSGPKRGALLPGKGITIWGTTSGGKVEQLPDDYATNSQYLKKWDELATGDVDVNIISDLADRYISFVNKLNAKTESGSYIKWDPDSPSADGMGRPSTFGTQDANLITPKDMEDYMIEYAQTHNDSDLVKEYLGIIASAAKMVEQASINGGIKNLNITDDMKALMNNPNRYTKLSSDLINLQGSMPYLEQLFNAARNAAKLMQYKDQLPTKISVGLSSNVGKNTVTYRVVNPHSESFFNPYVSSSGVSDGHVGGVDTYQGI